MRERCYPGKVRVLRDDRIGSRKDGGTFLVPHLLSPDFREGGDGVNLMIGLLVLR